MEIDNHLGCAMSGLTADARTMIDHARVTAQNHAFTYDERIKVESVTQAVCDLALRFGESVHDEEAMMSRPFGVALLIAGIDEHGPQLYVLPLVISSMVPCLLKFKVLIDSILTLQAPSYDMRQKQSGQGQKPPRANYKISGIKYVSSYLLCDILSNGSPQQMTLKEAQVLTLRVLKQVMEEKLDQHNVQLAQVYWSRTSSLLP